MKYPFQIEATTQQKYLQALSEDNFSFDKIPQELKDNKAFLLKALDNIRFNNAIAMWRLSEKLSSDKELILKMITKYPWSIRIASEELRKDKEVALAAYKESYQTLNYFHSSLIHEIEDRNFYNPSQIVKYLESAILEEELQKDLSSTNQHIRKSKL